MPLIRNASLIKRFTDFFKLKVTDSLDSMAGTKIVPVVNMPIQPLFRLIEDVVINQSAKTIRIPGGKLWRVRVGHISYAASAGAGDRRIAIQIATTAGVPLFFTIAANTQAASSTETYEFSPVHSEPREDTATFHTLPFPDLWISDEFVIDVFDNETGDDTDDFTVRMIVEEMDIVRE